MSVKIVGVDSANPKLPDLVKVVTIDVRTYGAVCDGTSAGAGTDSTTAIQNAANAATALAASDINFSKVRLWFPDGGTGYKTTGPITVGANVQVWMDAVMWCTSTADDAILTVGTAAAYTTGAHRYQVRRVTLSSWTSEANIGLKLVNFHYSTVDVPLASFCTIGLMAVGDTKGFVYNHIHIGRMADNQTAIVTDAINSGWVNENMWDGPFNITCSSATSAAKSRYAISIRSSDGSYLGSNNNVFDKPSIEIAGVAFTGGAEAVAFDWPTGAYNTVRAARVESTQMVCVARFGTDAHENSIDIAYASWLNVGTPPENAAVVDTSTYRSNVFTTKRTQHARRGYLIYQSPNLPRTITAYTGSPTPTVYHIPNVEHYTGSGAGRATTQTSSRLLPRDDHVELLSTGAIAVLVDTQVAKRFRLDVDIAATGGRWGVQAFDANGAIIDGSSTPVVFRVEPILSTLSWDSTRGGNMRSGSDLNATTSTRQNSFYVDDTVKTIAVMLMNGTASMKLRGFKLYSLDQAQVNVWSANDGVGRKSQISPSYGYFNVDEIVSAAGSVGGWKCTTAGVASDTAWAASTAYALNDVVNNVSNVYRATGAGTSASSGGPTGTTSPITDGTVTWKWIGAKATFTSTAAALRVATASGNQATPVINTDTTDAYVLTGLNTNITSMTSSLSGTPTEGQKLWISITGTATRSIVWGASYESGEFAPPTSTNGTNRLDLEFVYNSATSKWRMLRFVTPRILTLTGSQTTPSFNTDVVKVLVLSALSSAVTNASTNMTGVPIEGQELHVAITGTATRALTWGASFEAGLVALPTTTSGTTRLDVHFIWYPPGNSGAGAWRCQWVA